MSRQVRNSFLLLLVLFSSVLYYSCGPAIHSFDVEPLTITQGDSVKLNWDVNGEPTLMVNEKIAPDDSTRKYLEFTLVVKKGTKEAVRLVQVTVVPKVSFEQIVFATTLRGDTLIAAGDKNSERWGNRFEIVTISSMSHRTLSVSHSDKMIELNEDGTPSDLLSGTSLEGYWEIRSLLTETEKQNLKTAPEKLVLLAKIQYKRR